MTVEIGGSDGVPFKTLYRQFKQILTKMPGLEEFTWRAPLRQKAVRSLRHCRKTIKRLHVNSTEHIEEWEPGTAFDIRSEGQDRQDQNRNDYTQEPRDLYWPETWDVSVFTGLEELTLTYVDGDVDTWAQQVAEVLGNPPNLRKMGLHISSDSEGMRDGSWGSINDCIHFFDNLCHTYAEPGAPPLKLRSLKCGTSIYPTQLEQLEKLTDLAYLEEVHLDSAGFYYLDYTFHRDRPTLERYDGPGKIIFDAFLSPYCPRLRRFSATRLRKNALDALRNPRAASLTRRLAVPFGGQMEEDVATSLLVKADPEFPSLPLCLRMMTLELKGPHKGKQTVEGILNNLVAANADTLEGLVVHIRGIDNSNLDSGHFALLLAALPRLPLLTQLLLLVDGGGGKSALTDNIIEKLAERLANAVPQLRYIGVCGKYWRVWRFGSGGPAVSLERLYRGREREGVELFSIAFTSFQVGLARLRGQ